MQDHSCFNCTLYFGWCFKKFFVLFSVFDFMLKVLSNQIELLFWNFCYSVIFPIYFFLHGYFYISTTLNPSSNWYLLTTFSVLITLLKSTNPCLSNAFFYSNYFLYLDYFYLSTNLCLLTSFYLWIKRYLLTIFYFSIIWC